MEEAAQKRLERLRRFELGVTEPVIVGVPKQAEEEVENEEESPFATVESLARVVITENTFVPDQPDDSERIELRRQNWDLKREYERKREPLELEKTKIIEGILEKRMAEESGAGDEK